MSTTTVAPAKQHRNSWIHNVIRPVGYGKAGYMGFNKFLHSRALASTLDVLLVIDVLILIVSISLEIEFLKTEIDDFEHACLSGQCSMFENAHEAEEEFDEFGNEDLEMAEEILVYISVGILSIFLLELTLLFIANPREFLQSPFHCADFVIVSVSLIFEVAFEDLENVGFLVVARTWRFVRIGHGIVDVEEHAHRDNKSKEEVQEVDNALVMPTETEQAVLDREAEPEAKAE